MAALDHRALDREADADFDLPTEALGRMTLVSELGEDGGAEEGALGALTEAPPSQGPAAPEPPFNIHALAGNGGMAAAVLEQPAAASELALDPDGLFDAATAGPGGAIPHKAQMESSFGRSFDDVTAYLGATAPLHAMDAEAAARGTSVAFDSHDPSPEKVAHELTHVEQFRRRGGAAPVMASGAISDHSAASEHEAEAVAHAVAGGSAAPAITAAPGAGIQRSFISFVGKMAAKKATKGMLKNFIKTRIKDKIKHLLDKKLLKEIVDEADDIMGILEDPWWVTAIGFIPVVGDAFDLYNVPKQIAAAIRRADQLEDKAKRAIDAQQAAQRTVSMWKKVVSWTAHGGKHVPNPKLPWKDIVDSTKSGPAKYMRSINIEDFERKIWAEGKKVTNGKTWKVMEFPEEIGASAGKGSRWVRVEESGGTIHGHPITLEEFQKLLR